jgi:hypothetical protein
MILLLAMLALSLQNPLPRMTLEFLVPLAIKQLR